MHRVFTKSAAAPSVVNRHSAVAWDTNQVSEHYFSEAPSADFTPRQIEVVLAGEPRQLMTAGGVFSPEHLDRGTEVLLRTLERLAPAPEAHAAERDLSDPPQTEAKGPLLDLGCGWGPIALAAALRDREREVWAIDVNERSRLLTAQNADRLGLTNIRVAAPLEVPDTIRFAQIHSNPPIRVGKQALHEMLQLWLSRLAPQGSAYLVVAKHLGADSLQRWIASNFTDLDVSRIGRDKGFHVIEAVKAG